MSIEFAGARTRRASLVVCIAVAVPPVGSMNVFVEGEMVGRKWSCVVPTEEVAPVSQTPEAIVPVMMPCLICWEDIVTGVWVVARCWYASLVWLHRQVLLSVSR